MKDGSWLDKCPVCKSGRLSSTSKKKFWGLTAEIFVECDSCHARFDQKENKYQLSSVTDSSSSVWSEYGNQILEEREWKSIADGGLSDEKQKEIDVNTLLTQLRNGFIPYMRGDESSIVLKKKEELILSAPNVSLLEARAVTRGAYGGPSFRVAKGVSVRLGGFQAQSHDELKMIDQGTITLTNNRIIFSGQKRTINIPLAKVISIEPYSDAIALRREGKEKTQYFTGIDQTILGFFVGSRIYHERLSGLFFRYILEGLTRETSDEVMVSEPKEIVAWFSRKGMDFLEQGHILYQQGKYDEAIQAADKSVELNPQLALAWDIKGLVLSKQSKHDEALQAFNKSIELDPKKDDAWSNKGAALSKQGNWNDALQAFEKAIEINPQEAGAWCNKSAALYNLGKYDEVLLAVDEAIRINPHHADVLNIKAAALRGLGRNTEAEAALVKAKELGYTG